jgi:predicted ATPase
VGVPGIGKSRLVYELWRVAEAEPELIGWRQGRSLPYGEGVSFWALAEMVKALSLAPLSDEDTARLIGLLRGRAVLDAGQQTMLLARAGGNPLYAEQYVQMLAEQRAGPELPVPDSVQGIIAVRLDLLAAAAKRLLQDAAVIGQVFWPGAVLALGGGPGRGELEEPWP